MSVIVQHVLFDYLQGVTITWIAMQQKLEECNQLLFDKAVFAHSLLLKVRSYRFHRMLLFFKIIHPIMLVDLTNVLFLIAFYEIRQSDKKVILLRKL